MYIFCVVDLRVMTMKGDSTLTRALELHHQMQLCYIQDTAFERSSPSVDGTVSAFQVLLTE